MTFKMKFPLDPVDDNLSQWVRDRIADPAPITLDEYREFRMNSWEREAIYPKLTDEALADVIQYSLDNCGRAELPASTYNNAIWMVFMPLLLKRFKEATK